MDLRPTNSPYSVLWTVWVKCVINGAINYDWLALGLKWPFDHSQNLGPNCLNLLKPFVQTVAVRGLLRAVFGWLNCEIMK